MQKKTNDDKKNVTNMAKGALLTAAVVAGGAAAVALSDKETRAKVNDSLKSLGKKTLELRDSAQEWVGEKQDEVEEVTKDVKKNAKIALSK